VAVDVNRDGLVATTGTTTLDVLYGTATGGLIRRAVAAGRSLNVLSLEDMNSDGWLDVAAVGTSTNVVVIFRGSGDPQRGIGSAVDGRRREEIR
jgi:hypothetical protein